MDITDDEAQQILDHSYLGDSIPGVVAVTVLGLGGRSVGTARRVEQPSPYSASLPRVDAVRAVDTALAFGELEAWIDRAPGDRGCWAINRRAGKWRVGLGSGEERFTAGQDIELRGAIRNALMIAKFAGHL